MITVNGAAREAPAGVTVADLVAELAGDRTPRGFAVAVNGEVVPRPAWSGRRLADGDRVEVLSATPGG